MLQAHCNLMNFWFVATIYMYMAAARILKRLKFTTRYCMRA
ncbi:hypothetical protein MTBUT4_110010 [Magnetospirillum sp. UT-4]|nr:hypothetical protein MTBUT4_110010 [Magnetospirillum sp. UT-4]